MSSIHYPWGAAVGDTKPVFKRKRKKDGSVRKARVFGKPWWFETAGWSLEKCDERRTAILEQLKETWPDLSVIKNDGTDTQQITDCIKPLVATFNDSDWCLPKITDIQKRSEEQLSIYTAWAKFIIREVARTFGPRQTSNPRFNIKTSLSTAGSPDAGMSIPDSEQATTLMTPDPLVSNTQRRLQQQWGQTRTVDRTFGKKHKELYDRRKSHGLTNRSFSEVQQPSMRLDSHKLPNEDRIARSYSFVTSPGVGNSSAINTNNHVSDSETEVTDTSSIAESMSPDSLDTKDLAPWTREMRQDSRKQNLDALQDLRWKESSWQDKDWDDVVVKIDATKFDGERYPIPMTMLKPGSNKEVCRWDDFEVNNLYSRFEIESGQAIDRTKYMILLKINGKWTPIKTPGQYKLMLKQFSRATRLSMTMTLSMRIELKSALLAKKDGRRSWNGYQSRGMTNGGQEKSQFTGAASDFSTESETEASGLQAKRHKQSDVEQVEAPAMSEAIVQNDVSQAVDQGATFHQASPSTRMDRTDAVVKKDLDMFEARHQHTTQRKMAAIEFQTFRKDLLGGKA